jgi:hypothetical protein
MGAATAKTKTTEAVSAVLAKRTTDTRKVTELKELMDFYEQPFDGHVLVTQFDGWRVSRMDWKEENPIEFKCGEVKHFGYNGGFDAFVGVKLSYSPEYHWYAATRYPGDAEPQVLFHSAHIKTVDDFIRLAKEHGLPAEISDDLDLDPT